MNKVRAAIIGCGNVAHLHARALQNIPTCQLVAAHSRTEQKGDVFARQYGIKAYTDVTRMVEKEQIDVVVVCTPHPDHKAPSLAAMEAGAHVLVEKPLAASLQDCDEMIASSKKHNKKLGVVSQRRFYPACMRMKKAIDDGKIGRPALGTITMLGWRDQRYYESASWRGTWKEEGGGVLVNQAPHQLDLFQWLMNDSIEELYGTWRNINHPYIEVEDTAVAIVKFKQGGIGNILVSNSQKPGIYGKVHIHGSNGASVGVQTDGGAMFIAGMSSILEPSKNDIWTIPGEEAMTTQWEKEDEDFFKTIDPIEYYIRQQDQDFIHAVVTDKQPLVTAQEGRKTVEIFTALYRSKESNRSQQWPLLT